MDCPNIFEYGTRELTQDAVICCFLASLKYEKTREIGMDFLREFVLKSSANFNCEDIIEKIDRAEKIEVRFLETQCCHMDIYAEIEIDGVILPIIFEDKTDTFLHGNQFLNYCQKVNGWCRKYSKKTDIIYILYKTGYLFEDYKKVFEQEQCKVNEVFDNVRSKLATKNDMLDFISILDFNNCPEYILQYNEYVKHLVEKENKAEASCDMETHIGQYKFFREYFGCDADEINFVHKKDVYTYIYLFEENNIDYCIRTDKNKVYLQQCNENDVPYNNKEYERIKDICAEIAKQENLDYFFDEKLRYSNKNKRVRVFHISFNEKNTPEKVGGDLKLFTEKLKQKLYGN